MTSTPRTPGRAARALLLAGAFALASASLLASLHQACAHGVVCGIAHGPLDDAGSSAASSSETCAVCRLVQGTPPALAVAWTPPAPLPVATVAPAPAPRSGQAPRPVPCVRAPPGTAAAAG